MKSCYHLFYTPKLCPGSIAVNVLGFVAVGEIEFVQPVQMPIKDKDFKLEQNAEL